MVFGLVGKRTLLLLIAGFIGLLLLPRFLPRFYVYLLSQIWIMGLLATSLNMVFGFGGMYQFAHAVFYGTGAYATALVIVKTGVSPWIGFLAGPPAGAFLAFLMGLITIRLTKLYFGMLQISLGSLVWALIFRWYAFTGGDDGIHGIPIPDIIYGTTNAYYFTLLVTALCLAGMFFIVNSPFGLVFRGIRDNPERSEAVGVDVKRHQIAGQVTAGFFAGVAGALFVFLEGSVFPDLLFWTLSLEILVMCLLGGWFVFLGPMLGAALMISLRTFVGSYTEYWTFIQGVVLMLLILFLPEGVLGFFRDRWFRGERTEGGVGASG